MLIIETSLYYDARPEKHQTLHLFHNRCHKFQPSPSIGKRERERETELTVILCSRTQGQKHVL